MTQTATGAETVLWDLTIFYTSASDPAIDSDLAKIMADTAAFAEKYRGRVATLTAAELATAMAEQAAGREAFGRIQSFAGLQYSTDTTNAAYGALLQKVREAGAAIQQQSLFFDLEWANVPDEVAALTADPALEPYRHYLTDLRKYRPYLLTEPEEKILSEKSVTGGGAWVRFFGEVVNAIEYEWEGKKVPQAIVLRGLYSPDVSVRKAAADSVTAGLRSQLRPITYIFNTVLADKASDDKLRKYPTWVSSRNMDNEVSDAAVDALVNAVTARYDIVARYYKLKRQLLGLPELFDYDRYASLSTAESRYTWAEAREIIQTAFNAFTPRMGEIAAEFFDKNWIHAPVVPGKRGGAFASPTIPSAHPFVFVNFAGAGRDVETLAHELGHGIHMYLSRPKGVFGAYTPLTTAEMASVFAEMLVFNDLMTREQNPQVRLSMLAAKLESTFATVFRQISMNRFEHGIHTARRTEGELTAERITAIWLETQRAMFGDSVTLREDYGIWWAYVNHFIGVPGYVYAYAFGELLVLALFAKYRQEGASFVPRYLDVLSQGGSDKPENILARAGVDLNDPNFWQEGLNIIDNMVSDMETLAITAR